MGVLHGDPSPLGLTGHGLGTPDSTRPCCGGSTCVSSLKPQGRSAAASRLSWLDYRDQCTILEPVSKSFEENNEAGKLDKAEEIAGVVLPANEDPALPLNPGEEAFDEPASHVAA